MLISGNDVAAALNLTSFDTNLSRIVAAVDAWAKRYCGRDFEFAERTEVVQGYGASVVFLRESPIAELIEVRIDSTGVFADDTIVPLSNFTFFADDRRSLYYIGGFFPESPRAVKVTYRGGYYTDNDEAHTPQVPADLREALILEAAVRYQRGPSEKMKSETIGSYSYTRFDDAVSPDVKAMLRPYRRI